mmetsp:Transcript_6639/g.10671  ORF Transcript_6639/g.10671 Transcript_6639/m.10671 type:complete len:116 (+) Transcript_6639:238-585(+)
MIGIIVLVLLCCGMALYNYIKKQCRDKKDVEGHLGVALARINNVDVSNPKARVIMGVGTSAKNIEEWIEDIWDSFDRDNNGSIDKREIQKFLDQTFEAAGMKLQYTQDDFDELYE